MNKNRNNNNYSNYITELFNENNLNNQNNSNYSNYLTKTFKTKYNNNENIQQLNINNFNEKMKEINFNLLNDKKMSNRVQFNNLINKLSKNNHKISDVIENLARSKMNSNFDKNLTKKEIINKFLNTKFDNIYKNNNIMFILLNDIEIIDYNQLQNILKSYNEYDIFNEELFNQNKLSTKNLIELNRKKKHKLYSGYNNKFPDQINPIDLLDKRIDDMKKCLKKIEKNVLSSSENIKNKYSRNKRINEIEEISELENITKHHEKLYNNKTSAPQNEEDTELYYYLIRQIDKEEGLKKILNQNLERKEISDIDYIRKRLESLVFSPSYNKKYIPISEKQKQNQYLINTGLIDILEKQISKIFLLGSLKECYKFRFFRNLFYSIPGHERIEKKPCAPLVEWTYDFNTLYLLLIIYSKTDISGMVLLDPIYNQNSTTDNESKYKRTFYKKRQVVDSQYFIDNNLKLIGLILIPSLYKKYQSFDSIDYHILAIYQRKKSSDSIIYGEFNNYVIYDVSNRLVPNGHLFGEFTILYNELRYLSYFKEKFPDLNFYFNKNLPNYIFISTKPSNYILNKYDGFIKCNIDRIRVEEDGHIRSEIKISIPPDNTILESKFDKTIFKYKLHGGEKNKLNITDNMIYDYIKKILELSNFITSYYFNNDFNKTMSYYYNNFSIEKLFFNTTKFSSIKSLQQSYKIYGKNKININNIVSSVYESIIKYNYYNSGFFLGKHFEFLLKSIYNDNLLEKSICEITTKPFVYEAINNIDVYLTNTNFFNLPIKNWKTQINVMKEKFINTTFYYNKTYDINKKYDIMIIELDIDIKEFISDYSLIEFYLTDKIIDKIKSQLYYLKYLNTEGTCIFNIGNLYNKKYLEIYYELCKNFKNVYLITSPFISKVTFEKNFWVICENKLSKKKDINKNKIDEYIYNWNKNFLSNKVEEYLNFLNYVQELHSNKSNKINIKLDRIHKQIMFVKKYCEEYNLEIKDNWKQFIFGNFISNTLSYRINFRTDTYIENKKSIFRTLSEYYCREKFGERNIELLYCKDNYKKNLFSEIEFYSLLSKKYDLKNILVVYICSENTDHLPLIFELFPTLEFHIISNKEKISNKNIKYIDKKYFDNTYIDIIKYNIKNKDIVFVNNMDCNSVNDLTNNEKWLLQLNSIGFMINFRLPYVNNIDKKNKENEIKYIKGDIYFEIYSSTYSTNTKLIKIRNKSDKFEYNIYDFKKYDEQLYFFNVEDRRLKYTYKDSNILKYHLLGYDDSYESVSEYQIIDNYLNFNGTIETIIKKLFWINNYCKKKCIIDTISCQYETFIKKMRFKNNINERKHKLLYNLIDFLKNRYLEIIYSLKNQAIYFMENTILTKNEYINQIKDMKNVILNLNNNLEIIFDTEVKKKNSLQYIIFKNLFKKTYILFNKLIDNIISNKHIKNNFFRYNFSELKEIDEIYYDLIKKIYKLTENSNI